MTRTRDFDRQKVLEKAMLVFWRKGVDGASIADLLKEMNISRSSMYETFGNKDKLLLEAIQYYMDARKSEREVLNDSRDVRLSILHYFQNHIDRVFDEQAPDGCLITSTTATLDHQSTFIQDAIETSFKDIEKALMNLLEKGKASGQIDPTIDSKKWAFLFLNLHHSINITSKINHNKEDFIEMIQQVLSLL
ncbi:TetR/AcrR family transcriptional regulator [Sporolactobacillus kofuensis]|uniref:TetR/AcrR family transcriptional regulator n=1 Tax=Sporolactobacillus kofuensis TaxID=269672 RepID=A0ABW1WFY3_9BACL|nr:TetR/AcrR family transcriptional regulator [Sporolactobacillus kofuensis]MCO7175225.1 TetR/AcrR family transcriptional regulator [Sporolactobacillus kofuensis]